MGGAQWGRAAADMICQPINWVGELELAISPRVLATASAHPPYCYAQRDVLRFARQHLRVRGSGDPGTDERYDARVERLFAAARVEHRQSVVDLDDYYALPRSTGERMAAYQGAAYALARDATADCLERARMDASEVTDLIIVSCTGYAAPGLDIHIARDFGMSSHVRRVVVGHMGCFGAVVGLRQALAVVRAYAGAKVALVSVELCSLHFAPEMGIEGMTGFALFGDAGAAVLLAAEDRRHGPVLVDAHCAADFATSDQMSWTITDQGFLMGLSPRVPVTLRRQVGPAVRDLLAPHGLTTRDVAHWLIHPGGPSVLEAIQGRLELSEEQMEPSWSVLRDHGNCSSATVLLILDDLVRSGRTRPGEWGVMMAFGPGLTLETCLLRF